MLYLRLLAVCLWSISCRIERFCLFVCLFCCDPKHGCVDPVSVRALWPCCNCPSVWLVRALHSVPLPCLSERYGWCCDDSPTQFCVAPDAVGKATGAKVASASELCGTCGSPGKGYKVEFAWSLLVVCPPQRNAVFSVQASCRFCRVFVPRRGWSWLPLCR